MKYESGPRPEQLYRTIETSVYGLADVDLQGLLCNEAYKAGPCLGQPNFSVKLNDIFWLTVFTGDIVVVSQVNPCA